MSSFVVRHRIDVEKKIRRFFNQTVEYKKEMYNLQLIPTFFNTSMTNLRDEIAYNLGYGEVVRTNNDDLLKKISNEMVKIF